MKESIHLPSGATVFVAKQAADRREEVCTAAVSSGLVAHPVKSLASVNNLHDATHPACLVADLSTVKKSDPQMIAALEESEIETPAELSGPGTDSHTLIASASVLHDVERAIEMGGITFLRQPFSRAELMEAIRLAIVSDQQYQQRQARSQRVFDRIAKLKSREREVLNMVYNGLPNKTIAKRLDVSERTVESLRSAVFKVMEVRTAVDLTRLLAEVGYGAESQQA